MLASSPMIKPNRYATRQKSMSAAAACACWSITALSLYPGTFLHAVRDELVSYSQENGTVQIKGEVVYKVTDVDVTIAEVRMEPAASSPGVRRRNALW